MPQNPEVEASIVKVAGDWALEITKREHEVNTNAEEFYFANGLLNNFQWVLKNLKDVVTELS